MICPTCHFSKFYRCKKCGEVFCFLCAKDGKGKYPKTHAGLCPVCRTLAEPYAAYERRLQQKTQQEAKERKTHTAPSRQIEEYEEDCGPSSTERAAEMVGTILLKIGLHIWLLIKKVLQRL